MKWTVVWMEPALSDLARLWNEAPDRQAVADAADQIDRLLGKDADRLGYAIDNFRLLRIPPLAVLFTVSPDDCLATVVEVRRSES